MANFAFDTATYERTNRFKYKTRDVVQTYQDVTYEDLFWIAPMLLKWFCIFTKIWNTCVNHQIWCVLHNYYRILTTGVAHYLSHWLSLLSGSLRKHPVRVPQGLFDQKHQGLVQSTLNWPLVILGVCIWKKEKKEIVFVPPFFFLPVQTPT